MLRISSRSSTWLLAGALLCACGGETDEPDPDAGNDASVAPDAGPDDGGTDDGGTDPDGGPTPLLARDEARAGVASMEAALSAVPVDMQDGSAFLQLDLIAVRLDAIIGEKISSLIEAAGIIGEKGNTTLALSDISVTLLVIAQQLDATVRELDAMIAASTWGASSVTALEDLETACIELRDKIAVLRDVMWDRFRAQVALGGLVPRDEPAYVDSRVVDTIGGTNVIDVVVEGRSAADPTATISASCGDFPAELRVVDAEGGELVPRTVGAGGGSPTVVSVPVGHDVLRVLRIELSISDPAWNRCTLVLTGRRQVRGAAEPIDALEQTAIAREDGSWSTNGSGIETMLPTGTLDAGRIATVEQFARDADAAVSRLRGLSATSSTIEAEDYEIDRLVLEQIIVPLADLLIADLGDPMVTVHIQAWRDTITALLAESAPGHLGATL